MLSNFEVCKMAKKFHMMSPLSYLLLLCVRTMQVLDFLSKSQRQAKGKQPNGQSQNLATITYEVCICH